MYVHDSALENGRLEYDDDGYDASYILWLYDNKIYMNDWYSLEPYVLERYEAEPHTLSVSDFEGYSTIRNMEEGGCIILELEKGKGTWKYDDRTYDAAISTMDNSRVNLRVNGEKTVYNHYIIREEQSKYYDILYRYIYLYNDESAICIKNETDLT